MLLAFFLVQVALHHVDGVADHLPVVLHHASQMGAHALTMPSCVACYRMNSTCWESGQCDLVRDLLHRAVLHALHRRLLHQRRLRVRCIAVPADPFAQTSLNRIRFEPCLQSRRADVAQGAVLALPLVPLRQDLVRFPQRYAQSLQSTHVTHLFICRHRRANGGHGPQRDAASAVLHVEQCVRPTAGRLLPAAAVLPQQRLLEQ